jgi:hypothetical protein
MRSNRSRSQPPSPAFSNVDINLKVLAKLEPRGLSQQGAIDIDNDSIDFGNIKIPDHEVKGQGPIRSSQMQAIAAGAPNDQMCTGSLETGCENSDAEATPKGKHRNVTPAGPEALQVLR